MHTNLKTVLFLFAGIFAFLAVFIGMQWSTITRFQSLYFPFQLPKNHNLNKCRYLDKGLFGCEDIEIIDNYAVIACGNQKGRMKWWPPLYRFQKPTGDSDAVYAYDFNEGILQKLKLLRHPTGQLSLHGISAYPGGKENKIVVGLINHRKEGSCIELYDHRTGTDEIIFKELICDPLIQAPNSLALVSRNSFYLTNTIFPNLTTFQVAKSIWTGVGTGNIVFRSENGQVKVVKSNVNTPNGIAVMGSMVYVTLSAMGQVLLMEKNADGRLRTLSTITLPHIPDNVHVVRETGQLVLTGILDARHLYQWTQTSQTKIPSGILTVKNNTRNDSQFYGERYTVSKVILDVDGKLLSVPSIAAVHWPSKKMLVGGPMMKGLVECDWPSSL